MAERRYTVVFYAAVLIAAVATFGVYRVLQATKASGRIPMQPVVVAMQDLPEGTSIDRAAIGVAQWPASTVPAGAYQTLDSVAGRVTRVSVFKGEVLVPGRLAPAGTGAGLEVKISPGKRAMSIRINDVAGIAGLIQPNSRVDVLVTTSDVLAKSNQQVAKFFMANMRVLSVGTQVQRGEDGRPISAPTVTLEVTPDEAERLAVAASQGNIQLVLRGYGDPDSIKTTGASAQDVLAQLRGAPVVKPSAAPARPAARRPAPRPVETPPYRVIVQTPARPDSVTVQVFRGNAVTQQKFEKKDSTTANRSTP